MTESDFEVMSETESPVNGNIKTGKMSVKPVSLKEAEASCKETRCGFGSYSPHCLQKFNNPKALLFFLSCFCALQGKNLFGVGKNILFFFISNAQPNSECHLFIYM